MKTFLFLIAMLFIQSTPVRWLTDWQQAKQESQRAHKTILLNFSGSDWCGPCIRLRKDIFESAAFAQYAQESLVLLNADFPRLKKNALPERQQEQNDQLADTYNKTGHFPLTVLLSEAGIVLKTWDGNPGISPEEFISQVRNAAGNSK